jgi:hypothetical protein
MDPLKMRNRERNIGGYKIMTHNIPEYLDSEYYGYYEFYATYKKLGNPFCVGWMDWPCWAFDIINGFEEVYN